LLIALARGESWRLTPAQWKATILFGICQNALYLGLNFVAMQSVEASLAAIIASTMPLIVAFAGWAIFGERLPVMGAVGLGAGVAGVVIIMGARLSGGTDLWGVALCVVAACALAAATLSLRKASGGGGSVMTVVGMQMLVGAAVLLIPAAFETHVIQPSWALFWAFLYTTLVPGLAATIVWFLLVERIGAVRAATFHFLNPVFGVAIAAALLGEALRLADLVGVLVIAGGILAVQLSKQKPVQPPV
jgi:drug/metabolite transporter (DMT)-like permease